MTETILCLASYYKGGAFIEECKRQGCCTILITTDDLQDEAWPRDAIDEFFAFPGPDLNRQPDIAYAISYLARDRKIDRIIALDDFDVETAAALREHLRTPGMGSTTARYFRDKLAMRVQARDQGIPVPDFTPVLNYDRLRDYMANVPPPWVLKPRSEASAMGIKKINHADEIWPYLDQLGDRQSFFVLEKFLPGDVYHIDSIISEKEVVFTRSHKYGMPPMSVYQGGGVFVTGSVPGGEEEDQALQALNKEIVEAFGMVRGVTHTEFIRAHEDGQFYFLETAARVGGAGTDMLIQAESGLNMWAEWAKIEVNYLRGLPYEIPSSSENYAALMVCLSGVEWPDTSQFNAPELVWRMPKAHHVGMVVASQDYDRVQQLVSEYVPILADQYMAVAPPMDSAMG